MGCVLVKETPESPSPVPHVGHSESRLAVYNQEEHFTRTTSHCRAHLGFPASRTARNKYLLFPSPSVCALLS